MFFRRILVLSETQTASNRIWIRVADSISYDISLAQSGGV